MSFDIDVHTCIPAGQYKTLLSIAKNTNTTVSALIAELVRRGLDPESALKRLPNAEARSRLASLHEKGLSDTVIGRRIGRSPTWVQKARTEMGLPPVARPGRPRANG